MVCSRPFTGAIKPWRHDGAYTPRSLYLSCGDSAFTDLAPESVDLVLTDPPFFDNVHYSELADFFFAWQQLTPRGFVEGVSSTRAKGEVQDVDADRFAEKLTGVFREAHRVLRHDGLLVFTYHHSRNAGWAALAEAILSAGFQVVNAHPLKAEMSVATPKAQAKEPIQLDIATVCRKVGAASESSFSRQVAIKVAERKLLRLADAGFTLSRNDRKIVLFGQLLTTITSSEEMDVLSDDVEAALEALAAAPSPSRLPCARTDQRDRRGDPRTPVLAPEARTK